MRAFKGEEAAYRIGEACSGFAFRGGPASLPARCASLQCNSALPAAFVAVRSRIQHARLLISTDMADCVAVPDLSLTPVLVRIGAFCQRYALWVIGAALILSVLGVLTVLRHLSINTDTGTLIDPNLPWQQDNAALDKAFPQNAGLLAIVIDGKTPELAESAATQLTKALTAEPSLFR